MVEPTYLHNQRAWDERAKGRKRHTKTVEPEHLKDSLPILDPEGWLGGNVRGQRALCLASGGGLQGPMFAAAGAETVVVDLSSEMLALDKKVAARHALSLETRQLSMDDLSALPAAFFDIVLQPVSTCYVPDVRRVFAEVARVARPGAVYISQHKQPANLQGDMLPTGEGYLVRERYFRSGPLPPLDMDAMHREADAVEYLHRWEDILGGLCRAGFTIEDAVEPRQHDLVAERGTFQHRCCYLPPYIKLKARRREETRTSSRLIVPA
ncbi:MAG TPA: class I SAM-dependent methyltransferase [Methylomirabilota bacterium]|nr:class I SAM-dependent methyltransferase [Methylomirabilota bacterium]